MTSEHPTPDNVGAGPAYLVASVRVTGDPAELALYRDQVEATVAPFGGRYLARCNDPAVLEGSWEQDQVVLVEFPSLAAAQAWDQSPQYRAIAPLRIANTHSTRLLVPGLPARP